MQASPTSDNGVQKPRSYPTIVKKGTFPASEGTRLGVLLLHGFTSHTVCVSGLIPYLESAHIEYEMPWLRGHGGVPKDLIGVTSSMWYEDGLAALGKLAERVDRIVIVGLSMGGVVALQLCADAHPYRSKIVGCVTWAAALAFKNPLSVLVKPLSYLIQMWPGQESFNDMECKKKCQNYPEFPTKAFASLYDYAATMRKRLDEISVPLCAIHSKLDQVIPFKMSQKLVSSVRSPYTELVILEKSGHELGQDCEAKVVFEQTMRFLHKYLPEETDAKPSES